jgi:cytokinin riboside 5'-monophosphate phosphoribohydrolase
MKNICVYCSSSDEVPPVFYDEACRLGQLIGENNYTLVYGGASVGLMGRIADSVHTHGGTVISIMPELFKDRGITYQHADEIIYARDLRERKALMEQRADAFIGLAGGFGTLEEIAEIITLKQLQLHNKPIVFINTKGFYDNLFNFFETIYAERFAKPIFRDLYHCAADADTALSAIREYRPPRLEGKWY